MKADRVANRCSRRFFIRRFSGLVVQPEIWDLRAIESIAVFVLVGRSAHRASVELHQLGLALGPPEVGRRHHDPKERTRIADEPLHRRLDEPVPVGGRRGSDDTLQHQDSDAQMLYIGFQS